MLTTHISCLIFMEVASPTKAIFAQNDNKTQGTSSHLWLIIQAHESFWGNFGSRGFGGPRGMFSKTPMI